jgi:hypothetical protein
MTSSTRDRHALGSAGPEQPTPVRRGRKSFAEDAEDAEEAEKEKRKRQAPADLLAFRISFFALNSFASSAKLLRLLRTGVRFLDSGSNPE